MKQLLLFFLLLIFVTSPEVAAQKRKSERAYTSFTAGEYYDAIDLFKDAYSKTKKADKNTRTDLVFMIAECYRLTNDPKNAETWYKKAIAVNSFSQVFEIELSDSFKHFNQFLNQNQIAKPQFLFSRENIYFISGPEEILKSIENFEKNQTVFTIKDKNISSISVTYSEITQDADLAQGRQLLADKKIECLWSFNLMNSLHFFVQREHRNEAIQVLHQLIS